MPSCASLTLSEIYEKLIGFYGPQHWWPAETPFEVIVGAVLTQNTNWKNVERAIQNLKSNGLLTLEKLNALSQEQLAELIRPAGYFNVKAGRLKNTLSFLTKHFPNGLETAVTINTTHLRNQLLSIHGVGPETADAILLYAFHRPIFVIDQYTYRVLNRHFLIAEETEYDEMQEFMMSALPHHAPLFNEYHALLVQVGKDFCKPKPVCSGCPLNGVHWNL